MFISLQENAFMATPWCNRIGKYLHFILNYSAHQTRHIEFLIMVTLDCQGLKKLKHYMKIATKEAGKPSNVSGNIDNRTI